MVKNSTWNITTNSCDIDTKTCKIAFFYTYGVFTMVFLKLNIVITGGTGTKSDLFEIALKN